jgi:purine-binding chemotaxis protein CheW
MSVYVRLRIGSEAYAMPVQHVREVVSLGEVTAVPGSRPEMLGVRNLRGQILPVIDLALLLGISASAPPGRLLVAEAGCRAAGFAIDAVSEVGELQDPAEEAESGLLIGATLAGGDLIGLIDVPRIFDSLEGRGSERSGR